ncbi:RNA polymerase sigma factor [Pedobacter sp.]|jgi:RNA polymerase sigma factor (sigma-70 family)|uniref:RNA polymerase sigma factor n=1 Tax=Pedobacter sp. TaxID=1411316 RepID=UPI002D112640|nr:RNA polymerase sigma factor [Pedobacter sp.]HWW38671.1 RNA polymerase sigma factor [Pedobacter sp.]
MNLFAKRESRIIKGCKANERSAQAQLYKLFYPEMLRLCYRYLKSDDLVAEALNSGFLKVFQHINSFEESKGELGAWIKTIIIRTCIDLGRKEARFSNQSSSEDEIDTIFILPEILEKLYTEDLMQAIHQLPHATKIVFNLSVIEEYTHKEIADHLDITEGTSRWHLSEAKKQLRKILSPAIKDKIKPTEKQEDKSK